MSINVVYLSYFNESAGYGFKALEDFLSSYVKNPAGIKHSLTIIAKNWTDKTQYEKLCKRSKQAGARVIDLPDDGLDFGAYFRVSKLLNDDYFFFIGTSSLICSANWLSHCYSAFKTDNSVRLVGPMGSWGDLKKEKLPNYHIRTCSFMIKRDLFLEYASIQKFPETKEDTYEIEHGETSLTNFVLNKGLKAVVVNNIGKVYNPELWPFCNTYRVPDKSKSLLVDRHSMFYYKQVDNDRRFLERAAWGFSLKTTGIKIFVAHHKPAIILESDVFQPIFNGSNTFKTSEYGLRDNIGMNISQNNNRYRELTGHYCVWKNILPYIKDEYVGFSHYNRFLDFNISTQDKSPFVNSNINQFKGMCVDYSKENILKCIEGSDVVLPYKCDCGQSLYELYGAVSDITNLDLALDIITKNNPEYTEAVKKVLSGSELYACLIFVMKRELVCEYMEWIFPILEKLEQKIDWVHGDKSTTDNVLVNIAEIFFNIWLVHNSDIRKLKITETTGVFVEGMLKSQEVPSLF